MGLAWTLRMLSEIARGAMRKPAASGPFEISYRVWPAAADIFGHMNNAMYARFAELARWHIIGSEGLLRTYTHEKTIFLVVEQTLSYLKPIPPFRRFVVRTTARAADNKWIYFDHSFENEAGNVKYAHAAVKGVSKKFDGRTVPPSSFAESTVWLRSQLLPGRSSSSAEATAKDAAAK